MPVPSALSDLSTTAADNFPGGGEVPTTTDDYLRAHAAFLALLRDRLPTAGTSVSASGTAVDFTSIPSWAQRITLSFANLSSNGTSPIILQIGDSGGVETTGYNSVGVFAADGSASTGVSSATGFAVLPVPAAVTSAHGTAVLTRLDSATNHWVCAVTGALTNVVVSFTGGGSKVLSSTLDRIRLTTVGGVNTFDAGSLNVLYE